MVRRRQRNQRSSEQVDPALPPTAPKVATSFGELWKAAQKRKPGTRAPATEAPPPVLPAPGPAPLVPIPSHAPPKPVGEPPQKPGRVPMPRLPDVERSSALTPAEQAAMVRAFAGARPIARPARGRKAASRRPARPSEPPDSSQERAAQQRLGALVAGGARFELQRDVDEVTGLASGADARLLRRLCGSAFTPEATLDLHGFTVAEVAPAVERFVRSQKRAGRRHLLLIHGKGQHSPGGVGVLGDAVVDALVGGGAAPVVAAFATPHGNLGGRGALAVALR